MNADKQQGPELAPGETDALRRYEEHKKEIAQAERARALDLERATAAVEEYMAGAEERRNKEMEEKRGDRIPDNTAAEKALEDLHRGKPQAGRPKKDD